MTSIAFTSTPRGFTSVDPSCCATWLEPQFRADFIAASRQLEGALASMTKAQLVDFLTDAGKLTFEGERETKADLVTRAMNAQLAAWYPEREVTR